MLIRNALAVRRDRIQPCDIRVTDGKIAAIAPQLEPLPDFAREEIYDAGGSYVLPGLIDSHTHGAVGSVYYRTDCDVEKITAFEASEGVTAVAATLESAPIDREIELVEHLLPFLENGTPGARLVGIHFEGPFLNPAKKGAMDPDGMVLPNVRDFDRLYEASRGYMKLITVAPEMPGAAEVIRRAAEKGVAVSAGHSMASYEEMKQAIDLGVTRMTHTFNACRPFEHREPGLLGAALTDERVTCEVICDFAHLHPAAVELIYRAKGSSRFTAISDSEFAAGLCEGRLVSEDGTERYIDGGVARLADGTICGSASSLWRGFVNLCSLGLPLWEVSETVSANPARALGIYDRVGSIDIGKEADLCVVSREMKLQKTFVSAKGHITAC